MPDVHNNGNYLAYFRHIPGDRLLSATDLFMLQLSKKFQLSNFLLTSAHG
jgi:hypothetical protein